MLRVQVLKKSTQFKNITSLGQKIYSDSFIMFYHKKSEPSSNLSIGFTASKRVGGAVQRNLCKRRMKSLAFDLIRLEPIHDYELVIIARSTMLKKQYSNIKIEMEYSLRKIQRNINQQPH